MLSVPFALHPHNDVIPLSFVLKWKYVREWNARTGGGEGTHIVWVFIILISLLRKGFLSDPEILTAVAGRGMSTVLGGELYLLAW